jgi:hypothetical protein
MTTRKQKSHPDKPKQYVVGRKAEEFYSLMTESEGEETDDCDNARRFTSLADSVAYSVEHGGSVFELLLKDGQQTLRELLVDLQLVEAAPFDGCYQVADLLIAGPAFLVQNRTITLRRIAALAKANVRYIVTLATRAELFWSRELLDSLQFEQLFRHSYFPVPNAEAPSREYMRVILDAIDEFIDSGGRVFLHCVGGRGRSGTVAACWLVRHGVATPAEALDKLAEIRYLHGIFTASPETDGQRQLVKDWVKGQ